MLPSRCLRCGAVSREPLCASCVDYIVAYHPLWLDPSLLPGPSLLDSVGTRETAIASSDLSRFEWRASGREPTDRDAIRLVDLLGLEADVHPVVSAGDAEVLHAFLGRAKRGPVSDPDARRALAALYRYLATRAWMPPHLASEYELRARTLTLMEETKARGEEVVTRIEEIPRRDVAEELTSEIPLPPEEALEPEETHGPPEASATTPEETGLVEPAPEGTAPTKEAVPEEKLPIESVQVEVPPEALVESPGEPEELLPAAEPAPPEPLPEPEPTPPKEPEPEPAGLSPEEIAALEGMKQEIEREKQKVEEWVRVRSGELEVKERGLAERERAIEAKGHAVEEQEKAVTDRLMSLEKDEARREVLRFLGRVPGMSEDEADVIATAFPDMRSLESADGKALTQCRGVSEALARAIRYELVPGEVEEEQRAIRLREEGQAFMEEGDYAAALECYDRLLDERPEDVSLWFDKAELHTLMGRQEDALQCYTHVLDMDRRNRRAWFDRANLLFGMSRLADALDSLREGLKIDPSKAGDIISKADQLRRDGRPNDAAVLLQAVLDVDASNTRAVLALGDTLMELGDVDAAEGLFTRALGKDAQNPQILFRKGQLLGRKGRWGASIQFYNRAIALRWDYADAWLAKAEVLLAHARSKEALECFDKVISFEPERVQAWAGKALAHGALDRREEAANTLERARQIDPNHPTVRAAREKLASVEPMLKVPSPRAKPAPSFAEAFQEAGEGRPPEAPAETLPADFKSFVEAIEPEREDVHVLLEFAELALEGGDAEMALLRYGEAIEREPRNADAWTGQGTALQYLERYEEALEAYDRALELKPNHGMAKKWRETCLRHLGRGKAP